MTAADVSELGDHGFLFFEKKSQGGTRLKKAPFEEALRILTELAEGDGLFLA